MQESARWTLRRAVRADLAPILSLVGASGLPADGVGEWLDDFVVAEEGGRVVGVAGMERYRDGGLLRSVAVAEEARGTGLGRALVQHVLEEARARDLPAVYLLTTTAEAYFPRFGFARVERSEVPASVQESIEFRTACPASAVAMGLKIEDAANSVAAQRGIGMKL